MKLTSKDLLASPSGATQQHGPQLKVTDRRRIVGIKSGNGSVNISLFCINNAHVGCAMLGCTCVCHVPAGDSHKEKEAEKPTAIVTNYNIHTECLFDLKSNGLWKCETHDAFVRSADPPQTCSLGRKLTSEELTDLFLRSSYFD